MIKQISGQFQRVSSKLESSKARIKVGVKGMADVGGWIARDGGGICIPFQIEVKTGAGTLSGDQQCYAMMCHRTGMPILTTSFTEEEDLGSHSEVVRRAVNWIASLSA